MVIEYSRQIVSSADRRVALAVHEPEGLEVADAAVARDRDLTAGDLAGFDVAGLEVFADALELTWVEACGVGVDLHAVSS